MGARLWNQNNNIIILVPRGRRSCRAPPVPQRVDAPHARIHAQSARAAVRGPGAVQFALSEQGRRSRRPCGTRCPALAASVAHCALSGAASYFFLVSKPSNSCNQIFFRSRNKHQNRSGIARPYLAPAVRCGKERPSDCRGAVQQLPAESWEAMRSVKASHRRNTWLTLFPTAGERRLRGTRAGQWTPPV